MLKKENIYVSLQGKSKEELTELYSFLNSIGEKVFRDNIDWFLEYSNLGGDYAHLSYRFYYANWGNGTTQNKQEVTIEQLKDILQSMGTLTEQLKKAEAEVKRLKKEINKIKVGDWVVHNELVFKFNQNTICKCEKITDQELINKLNELIK